MNATINVAPSSTFILLKNVCLCKEICNMGFIWQKIKNFLTFHNSFFFISKIQIISPKMFFKFVELNLIS